MTAVSGMIGARCPLAGMEAAISRPPTINNDRFIGIPFENETKNYLFRRGGSSDGWAV
jgi:hypothetical protein